MPDMDTGMGRHNTDPGHARDKVAAASPAAAPVDADAEASGNPTPRAAIMASLVQMLETARHGPRPGTFGAWRQPDADHQRKLGRQAGLWLVAVPVALGLLAGWISWS